MSNPLPAETWKERIEDISDFYCRNGRMPSYSEIGVLLGIKSKNAVSKVVDRLQKLGAVARDRRGRILPRSIARPLRVLGTVEAGFPSPAEEELVDTLSLDDFLVKNRQASFLLKVSGDSMSGAGIIAGDLVIVDRSRTPKNGDIVIAEVDGEWTMKYLKKTAAGVVLVPANPNYKPIKPKTELKVAGVVTAVVRKYG
ncbi:MAG: repressor LexA [Candidatus Lindowbacteria bacterium RIFCSPLOWO2_12_FULL_62_27]|nr:MAG: repressor LexA [Candidatus Lindowbacteria bacterium RIFCSPLOWO2_02_FULL_62_12]OGH59067.1 MAG: repressor LexA [Candidatus Lindowbacteria bacterium RIFCSPLOWO2_12_FULL_62_27]